MRCLLSNRKVRAIAKKLELPIEKIMVRGGTEHRMDLCLSGGLIIGLWPDGSCVSDTKWRWGSNCERI
jgi:hypothetical protein